MQQIGYFPISPCELVKTCNLCPDASTHKNIWDQIIESLLDDDTVEDLLQETDSTLTKAVHKCQGEKIHYTVPLRPLQYLRNLRTGNHNPLVEDVVLHPTQVGESNAQHTARYASTTKRSVILPKCVVADLDNTFPPLMVCNAPHIQDSMAFSPLMLVRTTHPEMDNIKHVTSSDPASSISLGVIAANGSFNTKLFQTLVLTFWLLER